MGRCFSEAYGRVPGRMDSVREPRFFSEEQLQRFWGEGLLVGENLKTVEGHRLRVIAPGWHNRAEGPDFLGAQLEFNGVLHGGDVEMHRAASGWRGHGHQRDTRYNNVILHVVLEPGAKPAATREGRMLATLALANPPMRDFLDRWEPADGTTPEPQAGLCGRCARDLCDGEQTALLSFLDLAGEWRILTKARAMEDRATSEGMEQALYESALQACGYSRHAAHFRVLARTLPYERVRQLALQEPLLAETALFHLAGLLPEILPETADATAQAHHRRLMELRTTHLDSLRNLGLEWHRAGVRPVNAPERRLAGAARLLCRTAKQGLLASVMDCWKGEETPVARRRRFEALFSPALGFWAGHCSWGGKTMARNASLLGEGRVRSLIGNVFLPLAVADARSRRDRALEERALDFLQGLPAEPENHVVRRMTAWIFQDNPPRLNFQRQQGLLQMHRDWCEANPSCRNCSLYAYFKNAG